VPEASFDIRFVPTPADAEYVNLNDAPSEFFGDRCAMLLCMIAPSAGLEFRARLTCIYEYQPNSTIDMPLTNPTTPTVVGGVEKLVRIAHRVPHFLSTLDQAAGAAYNIARKLATSNTFRIAAKAAPMLLTAA